MSLGDAIFGNHIDSAHTYDIDPNKYQYGGQVGGAEAARNRLQGMGQGFQNRGEITGDYGNAGQSRAGVMGALDMTRAAANGQVPSAAELQMNKGTNDALRSTLAAGASARGAGAMGAAQGNAVNAGSNLMSQNIANTGIARANEQATARGQLLQGTQGLNAADIGQAGDQARNQIASRGENDQAQLAAEGMGQRVDEDQLQAQQNQQQQQSLNENNAQTLNADIGKANAQNNAGNANAGLGFISGIADAAGGALGSIGSLFSDARLKTEMHPLTKAYAGALLQEHQDKVSSHKAASAWLQAHPGSMDPSQGVSSRTVDMTPHGGFAVSETPIRHETFGGDGPVEQHRSMSAPTIGQDTLASSADLKTDITPLDFSSGMAALNAPSPLGPALARSGGPPPGVAGAASMAPPGAPMQTWGGGGPTPMVNPNIPTSMGGGNVPDPLGDQFPVQKLPWEKGYLGGGGHAQGMMMNDAALKTADQGNGASGAFQANMPKLGASPVKPMDAKEAAKMPALKLGEHGGKDEGEKKSSYDVGKGVGGSLGHLISDRNLKGDIYAQDKDYPAGRADSGGAPTGTGRDPVVEQFLNSLHPYSFKYKDPSLDPTDPGTHYGVMAQDVDKTPMGHSLINHMGGPQGPMGIDVKRGLGAALAAEADLNERVNALAAKKGRR